MCDYCEVLCEILIFGYHISLISYFLDGAHGLEHNNFFLENCHKAVFIAIMYIVHDCTAQIHVTIDLSKSRRKCRCDGLPSAWLGNWGLHGLRTTSALAEWLWACLRITRSRVRDPRWEQGACTVLANAVMHFFFFFFYYVHINNQLEKNKERQWYGD